MLNYIYLENFRAFGEPTTIPLAPITLFFGENSAGKTSILHALTLLKQTAQSEDRDAVLVARDTRGLVDLGSFQEFIFDHKTDRVLRIGLGCSRSTVKTSHRDLRQRARVYNRFGFASGEYGKEWAFKQASKTGDIVRHSIKLTNGKSATPMVTFFPVPPTASSGASGDMDYEAAFKSFEMFAPTAESFPPAMVEDFLALWRQHAEGAAELFKLDQASVLAAQVELAASAGPELIRSGRRELKDWMLAARPTVTQAEFVAALMGESDGNQVPVSGLFSTASYVGRSIGARFTRLAPGCGAAGKAAAEALAQHLFLNVSREVAKTDFAMRDALQRYSPIGPFRTPAARLYTYSGTNPRGVGQSGELVADFLHRDKDCLKRTNEWMKAFGIEYELRLKGLGARRSDVFEVRLVDTRRRPKLDIAFTDVGFGISQMLPIVVQCVATTNRIISIEQPEVHIHPRLQAEIGDLLVECVRKNGHQFLIETHSEHLILRLRKLVREKKLKASDLCVVHVRRGKKGSIAERIRVNDDGSFADEWPGGFFPERIRELT